jgi:hypothetical protein
MRRSWTNFSLAWAAVALAVLAGCGGAGTKVHVRMPAPVHVQTWALDDGCNGGAGASGALVRRWVSFAESNCGPNATKALADCHFRGHVYCEVMQYLDTDWEFNQGGIDPTGTGLNERELHEPAPHQAASIHSDLYGGGYLLNQARPDVRMFFRSYVRRYYNADDGLFMDNQGPGLSEELYDSNCGCSTTNEIRTDAQLQAAHQAMSAALTHVNGSPFMQVDNAIAPNPWLPQGFNLLNRSIGVDGLSSDGLPEVDGVLDRYYSTLLDQIAYITTRTRGFALLWSSGTAGAAYQEQSRRVQEATLLLGYSPGRVVDAAILEEGSRSLAIWPEEGIYPTQPLQSMGAPGGNGCLAGTGVVCASGGHNDLQVAPGVYRREFAACYDQGGHFGGCAAIVNSTSRPVTISSSWLTQSYPHEITLVGGDVQSGGTVKLEGAGFATRSAAVGAHDAILLAG